MSTCTFQNSVIPVPLRLNVFLFRKTHPVRRICQRRDSNSSIFQRLSVVEVVGRTNDPASQIDRLDWSLVVEFGELL